LEEATNVIDSAGVRSRAIERRLKNVQELPQEKSILMMEAQIENEKEVSASPKFGHLQLELTKQ
jgi:DNA recombination protein RmuC